ncbi:hypothetical protein [Terracidiphilus gabretensis]|nr:hypothetical protein [Terracidiphilus gabretensis]
MKIVLMAPIAVVGIPLANFQNINKTALAAGSTVFKARLPAAQGVYVHS